MAAPSLAEFLAEDFERLGEAQLARCAPLDGQRLYLSGATGFFGRNLLALMALLQRRGQRFEVTALSRDPEAFFAREPWARALRWLDLRRADVCSPWPVNGPHTLMLHAATDTAAAAHVDAQAVFDGIVQGTREALAAAASAGVQRLLLTGSGAQYGAGRAGEAFAEDAAACDPTQPGSAYGEAKRVAELLAALHAQRHGTAVVATRCFAFVGPGLALDGHFAVGNFIRDALAGTPITLGTRGTAQRSYLYGADLALWLLILLLEAPAGTAVNVGSDETLSVRALAGRVRDIVAPTLAVKTGSDASPGPRPHYVPSLAHARTLGLEVWTPLELAIRRTAGWHRLQR